MARALNTNMIDFSVGDVGDDADQWSGWTAAAGGTLLIRRAVVGNPAALVNNQFYRVAARALILTQPRGAAGFTEDMAERGVRGYILGGIHVQLEQSSDDAALTGRMHVAQIAWTVEQQA